MIPDGQDGAGGAMEAQDQSLMDSILGTSGETSDTAGTAGAASGQSGANGQPYTFAGRQFKGGQSEAEKWANGIYGKFSNTQNTMKELKALFESDPESLQAASQDPKWAAILGKLGLEVAREEATEQERNAEQHPSDPEERYQALEDRIARREATLDLKSELRDYEDQLGRRLSPDEHNAVMKVIQRASSLSVEEAFNLAFHKKLMDEQAKKIGQNGKTQSGRPKPPPMHIPGLKVDSTKKPADMSGGEFREYLKGTQEFTDLVSRG